MSIFKRPESALVVIHTRELEILLLERAAHRGYWQSVTGSREDNEEIIQTALREVQEETGIVANAAQLTDWHKTNTFEIFEEWRHRYAPGVTHNTEHVFSFEVTRHAPIRLSPTEHTAYCWLHWQEAAAKVFSWSNRDAIVALATGLLPATCSLGPKNEQHRNSL
ncbi:MAG: dihydroneopterin triphosphate diphosphatase [Propionivibrio sp.]